MHLEGLGYPFREISGNRAADKESETGKQQQVLFCSCCGDTETTSAVFPRGTDNAAGPEA